MIPDVDRFADAACAGITEPLWDALVDGESEPEQTRRHMRALMLCRKCPVRSECAADIDLRHDDGVRGGIVLPVIRDSRRPAFWTYERGRSGFAQIGRS